jgi:outer membrane protein
MNFVKNAVFIVTTLFVFNAVAKEYKHSYYQDEGALLFKIRGTYLNTKAKLTNFPDSVANRPKPQSFAQNGYGFDTALTYFFSDNIGVELSTGVGVIRVKKSALESASINFGDGSGKSGKNNDVYYIPASATAQYHIAPFGGLRPYVGVGYNGTFMYTNSKAIKISSGHGPVLQVGVDFVFKNDAIFTFDIRQFFLKSKVTFKKSFLGGGAPDISSNVNWDPTVISAGFGLKF